MKGQPDAARCLCFHHRLAGAAGLAHSVLLVACDEIHGAGAQGPGNISADARTINGVHHTLSVWTDKDAMRAYLTAGPHLEAMRVSRSIATGKVVGFGAQQAPDWWRSTGSGWSRADLLKTLAKVSDSNLCKCI
jgi:hypothetical protein